MCHIFELSIWQGSSGKWKESLNLRIISISSLCPLKFKLVFRWLVSKESSSSCPNTPIDILNVHKRFSCNFFFSERDIGGPKQEVEEIHGLNGRVQ